MKLLAFILLFASIYVHAQTTPHVVDPELLKSEITALKKEIVDKNYDCDISSLDITTSDGQHVMINDTPFIIVFMHIEGPPEDNLYRHYMGVISVADKKPKRIGYDLVGGRYMRAVDSDTLTIKDNLITIEARDYSDSDAACCPSFNTHVLFEIKNGKLIETSKFAPYLSPRTSKQ